ncbi:hypothetical protein [Nonomuraea rhizosphaerae]|uniref:hypothetical protein n=1 Tax=Nonomuraea rhizosphaerae TaxID=2665663 RepID=UPI001C5F93C3|nr:hypothetical protein [Nonomuraea rhizosphaerae]
MPDDPYRSLYCRAFDLDEADLFGEGANDLRDDEIDTLELARRGEVSDVGHETLERLERVVDDLAVAYAGTAPMALLDRTRRHLSYMARLVDGWKTLAEHRRLLVPSQYWRAAEVITSVEARRLPEAGELREAVLRWLCLVIPGREGRREDRAGDRWPG